MLITWNPGMSVGIPLIDEEHQKLISYLNSLHNAIESNNSIVVLEKTLGSVMAYTHYHFEHEEELFSHTDYPDTAYHIKAHEDLTQRLLDIQSKFRNGATQELSIELMVFLKDWLVNHIQAVDLKYVPYVKPSKKAENNQPQ